MLANEKLSAYERALVLRTLGLNIYANKGQISNIKNTGYSDKTKSLCINLDTGQVKDFGNRGDIYTGDVFTLVGAILDKDFKETVKYFEDVLRKDLKEDGMTIAENLYGSPKNQKTAKDYKYEESLNFTFWSPRYVQKLQFCQEKLKNIGINKNSNYIENYDMITDKTLIHFGCGYYGWGDFEFGLGKNDSRNKKLRFVFPYETGAMLYRRDGDSKDVCHVKGSKSQYSFFNGRCKFNKDILFICKSPRETMLVWQLLGFMSNVIGVSTGENVKMLFPKQEKTLKNYLMNTNKPEIYVMFDCDNNDAKQTSENFCKLIHEAIGKIAPIRMVDLFSNTGYKDITDLVRDDFYKKDINSLTGAIASAKTIK
jgi:hypothetical protein